jgi:hypothetical protein
MIVKINRNFNLVSIAEDITDEMSTAFQEWGKDTVNDIRSSPNFPFDTGKLNRSIQGQFQTTDKGVRYTIGTNVHYAPYQEFGTILRFDPNYTSQNGLTSYASQFKGSGIIKNGGIPARRYFFGPVRRKIEDLIKTLNTIIKK